MSLMTSLSMFKESEHPRNNKGEWVSKSKPVTRKDFKKFDGRKIQKDIAVVIAAKQLITDEVGDFDTSVTTVEFRAKAGPDGKALGSQYGNTLTMKKIGSKPPFGVGRWEEKDLLDTAVHELIHRLQRDRGWLTGSGDTWAWMGSSDNGEYRLRAHEVHASRLGQFIIAKQKLVTGEMTQEAFNKYFAPLETDPEKIIPGGSQKKKLSALRMGPDFESKHPRAKDGKWTTKNGSSENLKKWFGKSRITNADGSPKTVYHGTRADFTEFAFQDLGGDRNNAAFFSDNPRVASGYSYHPTLEEKKALASLNKATEAKEKYGLELFSRNGRSMPSREKPLSGEMNRMLESGEVTRAEYDKFWELRDQEWDLNDEYGSIPPELGSPNVMPSHLKIERPYEIDANGLSWDAVIGPALEKVDREKYDGIIFENIKDNPGRDEFSSTTYAVFAPTQIKSATGNSGDFDPKSSSILLSALRMSPDFESKHPRAKDGTFSEKNGRYDSNEFREWFDNSKIVDDDGRPLVVYHGTYSQFSEFSKSAPPVTKGGKLLPGLFFFSESPEVAGGYAARGDGRVLPVLLSIKNPMEIEAEGRQWHHFITEIGNAEAHGYDGVIVKNVRDNATAMQDDITTTYIAFRPTQIKSATGNSGVFDSGNPSIVMSSLKMSAEFEAEHPRAKNGRWIEKGKVDIATNLEKQYSVGKLNFDSEKGKGSMGTNANINYDGFAMYMKPSEFLKLNPSRLSHSETKDTVAFFKDLMEKGDAIGPPYLSLEWDVEKDELRVTGHEGRGRMLAAVEFGADQEIPVHAVLYKKENGRRSKMQAGEPWHGHVITADLVSNYPVKSDSINKQAFQVSPSRFILDRKEVRRSLRMGAEFEAKHPRGGDPINRGRFSESRGSSAKKTRESSGVEMVAGDGWIRKLKTFRNPTKKRAKAFLESINTRPSNPTGEARGIRYEGNVWLWDAAKATHKDVTEAIGIKWGDMILNGERFILKSSGNIDIKWDRWSQGSAEKEYKRLGVKAKAFKKWFGDWENGEGSRAVNRSGEPQETVNFSQVTDDEGEPLIVHHGTTHEFDEFNYHKTNLENYYGKGFYFSSDQGDAEGNYAGEGPDLSNRIGALKDKLALQYHSDAAGDYLHGGQYPEDEEIEKRAEKEARRILHGQSDRLISSYLNIRKPVVVGKPGNGDVDHHKETMFFLEYPETGDEDDPLDYDNPQGSFVDLVEAVAQESRGYEFDGMSHEEVFSALWEEAQDWDGITASSVMEILNKAYPVDYDEDGVGVSGQLFQETMRSLGHDGIIDQDVDTKFRKMGVSYGSVHYIVFDPNQIKSTDNKGTFSTSDNRYRLTSLKMSADFEAKHPRDGKGRWIRNGGSQLPPVPEDAKRLYNASLAEHKPSTSERSGESWLDPHVSGWIEEVAGGTGYEGDMSDLTRDLIYMDERPTRWIQSIVSRRVGKMDDGVTLTDVRDHGRLNVIDADHDASVYRMGDEYYHDMTVETLGGERIKFWESDLYDSGDVYSGEGRTVEMPVGPEPNDWITSDSVGVIVSLTGNQLLRFIKNEDPALYKELAIAEGRDRQPTLFQMSAEFEAKHPRNKKGEWVASAVASSQGLSPQLTKLHSEGKLFKPMWAGGRIVFHGTKSRQQAENIVTNGYKRGGEVVPHSLAPATASVTMEPWQAKGHAGPNGTVVKTYIPESVVIISEEEFISGGGSWKTREADLKRMGADAITFPPTGIDDRGGEIQLSNPEKLNGYSFIQLPLKKMSAEFESKHPRGDRGRWSKKSGGKDKPKKKNQIPKNTLMKAAHAYAKQLAEDRGITYREAIAAALKEGWQAGRAWKGTPAGWKTALRYRAFVKLADKEEEKIAKEVADVNDDADPFDFHILMSATSMFKEEEHPRGKDGRWIDKKTFAFPGYDKYDTFTQEEKSAFWKKNSKLEKQWEAAVMKALSIGEITADEADRLGSRLSGREYKPLPKQLYHVTTAASKVRKEGLKTRDELNITQGAGLSGGANDTISYTDSKEIADHIHRALLEGLSVAKNEYTVEEMLADAKAGKDAPKPYLEDIYRQYNGSWKKGQDVPADVYAALNGVVHKTGSLGNPPKRTEFNEHDPEEWRPFPGTKGWGRDNKFFSRWVRDATEEEERSNRWFLYKHFAAWRAFAGGLMDPVFFMTDIEALAKVKESDVAIISATPKENAYGYKSQLTW